MSRYELNRAMYEGTREKVLADKAGFLAAYALDAGERQALATPNFAALLDCGGLPNLVYRYFRAHGLKFEDFSARLSRDSAELG